MSFHCSPAAGPVMVKLRFEREKVRESGEGFVVVTDETDLEVHASEGLEIFKFQVGDLLSWSCVHVVCLVNREIYQRTRGTGTLQATACGNPPKRLSLSLFTPQVCDLDECFSP